ncbi:hypothetical protein POPTR_003G153332v4 [Populus trichocarpa]|uniref:Uncharacterized protein n=1 Tax=Populus trichocarpa TaxID=3694 RepID=A0A3N7EPD4_POPTR|nr:hypothetical protein POPTR_003G153332v4 [Populus trichocarpa]
MVLESFNSHHVNNPGHLTCAKLSARLAALVNNGRCISLAATYCVNGRCCHSSLAGACGLPFDMNIWQQPNKFQICYGIWGLDRCLHLEVDSFMFRLW